MAYAPVWQYAHRGAVSAVKFSPDGLVVASSSADRTCALADARSGRVLAALRGHSGGVSDVAWSLDGDYVATASDDCSVLLWDVATVRAGLAHGDGGRWLACALLAARRPPACSTHPRALLRIRRARRRRPTRAT